MKSRKRAESFSGEIGFLLEPVLGTPQDLQGAYTILKFWHCHVSARATNPSWAVMAKVTTEYAALNSQEETTPPSRPVPTHVTMFRINDDIPTKTEADLEVHRLRLKNIDGHMHLRAEYFNKWLVDAYLLF